MNIALPWERIVWFITILWSHLIFRWWNITLCLDELVMEINIMITQTRVSWRLQFNVARLFWVAGSGKLVTEYFRTTGFEFFANHTRHPLAISCHRSLARYLSFNNTSHPSMVVAQNPKPAARFWLCKLLRFKSSQVSSGENHKNTWGISKSTFRKNIAESSRMNAT